ncbi:RadC family protein [Devosia sp. CAU 1758]
MPNKFCFEVLGAIQYQAKAPWSRNDQLALLANLLSPALGARRASETAGKLMSQFGSIAEVLAANPKRLEEIPGIGSATTRVLGVTLQATQMLASCRIRDDRPLLSSSSQLHDYLHVMMAHLPIEQFRIIFLDKRNRLIADEVQQSGTIDHTPVYPREVIKRSLELSASALILAHNHPAGDPTPSTADIRMTNEIKTVARSLGIEVHDHVIVGRFGSTSLRTLGLMDDMT